MQTVFELTDEKEDAIQEFFSPQLVSMEEAASIPNHQRISIGRKTVVNVCIKIYKSIIISLGIQLQDRN
jgi:hypothetical protein